MGDKDEGDEFRLPDGVMITESVESDRATLFTGDVVDMLKQLPIEKINAAFDTFDYQCKLQGDEIRSRRAYLRGILKGHLGRGDLPRGVNVPASLDKSLLDKEMLSVLKNMSIRDINSCFRDYDNQMKKKSHDIRNKSAYLLGIIKSGPHYNLPQDAIIPSTLSLSLLQGELLEIMQQLPAAQINGALAEYDEQVQKKGDSIRSKQGYLTGIMKRVKRAYDEEEAGQATESQKQATPPPKKEGAKSPSKNGAAKNGPANIETVYPTEEPSQGTLNLVTESFVKVTNELVIERQARNDLQAQIKLEQDRREDTNQRILKLMSELAVEKEQRERSALEVQRLKKDLSFERSLRENAEEKVQVLEDSRQNMVPTRAAAAGTEKEQLQKLKLDLATEKGLREKTEKLLQTAEIRIQDLNRELKYVQDRLHDERTKSPFGTWMANSALEIDSEDKKTAELPPGISELVSMTEFDPETFTFTNKNDLTFLNKVYDKNEILVTAGEVIRFLQLGFGKDLSENVQVNLRVQIPHSFPASGSLTVNAVTITNCTNTEGAAKAVEAALPSLIEASHSAATSSSGKEAVLSVLTAADYWVQNNWLEIQSKQSARAEKLEICRILLQASSINDQKTLRQLATKNGFEFGGFAKTRNQGLVLLEGLQKNSSTCLESLNRKQGSLWTSLSVVGRSIEMTDTLVSGFLWPKKLANDDMNGNGGIDKLRTACQQVGLSDSLSKVLS